MSDEKLSPERAVRLLRAKAAELEHVLLIVADDRNTTPTDLALAYLGTDIALVASLLADFMERVDWGGGSTLNRLADMADDDG